jgi:hypothetical protein
MVPSPMTLKRFVYGSEPVQLCYNEAVFCRRKGIVAAPGKSNSCACDFYWLFVVVLCFASFSTLLKCH